VSNRPDDVAFRKNAKDPPACVGNDDRANPLLAQQLGGLHQGSVRLGCDNVATFGRQNSRNAHLRLPLFGRRLPATPGPKHAPDRAQEQDAFDHCILSW
jgi:hypothetical protein